jgi:Ca-activated chloride channel family protein
VVGRLGAPVDGARAAAAATDMIDLARLAARIRTDLAEWGLVRLEDLQYWHRSEARLLVSVLVAASLVLLIARLAFGRHDRPRGVVLPALLRSMSRGRGASLTYLPLALFLLGLPFLALAVADPYTALVSRQASFPGRRIGLMIDASISMRTPFTAASLNRRAATEATFFTTVAAAERFVELRRKGRYRDLIGLVEFGNQAYVITPFTSDYDNILLSISLIGDPVEFNQFPDQGTIIAQGIEESVELFRAFDFLDASGNLMVIFTDGEDTNAQSKEKTLDQILGGAVEAKVPVYMVRTNYAQEEGQIIPDELWKPAVERTGGKFYAASDEASLLAAIEDIDRVSAGSIDLRMYSSQEPRFAMFALAALALWTAAAALKLGVPIFQRLP